MGDEAVRLWRRVFNGLAAAVLLASSAACGTSQQAEERYITFCAAQGVDPSSELFADCVESQRVRDALEAQRIRDMRGLRQPDR